MSFSKTILHEEFNLTEDQIISLFNYFARVLIFMGLNDNEIITLKIKQQF